MEVGQSVICGSIRGIIESDSGVTLGQKRYGVRLENGNFHWYGDNEVVRVTPSYAPEIRLFDALRSTYLESK